MHVLIPDHSLQEVWFGTPCDPNNYCQDSLFMSLLARREQKFQSKFYQESFGSAPAVAMLARLARLVELVICCCFQTANTNEKPELGGSSHDTEIHCMGALRLFLLVTAKIDTISVKLYADIVQLKSGLSVETLQTCTFTMASHECVD